MHFEERSYIEEIGYRPTPIIQQNSDLGLIVVATPWGKSSHSNEVIEKIESFLEALETDADSTSPYQNVSGLSPLANKLRNAILFTNEYVYQHLNNQDLHIGFELFVGLQREQEFVWTSIGHPHTLISKKGKNLLPIHTDFDFAMEFSKGKKSLPPLPKTLLGLHPYIDLKINSLKIQKDDKLVLISRSWIPQKTLEISPSKLNLQSVSKALIDKDKSPFWVGILNL